MCFWDIHIISHIRHLLGHRDNSKSFFKTLKQFSTYFWLKRNNSRVRRLKTKSIIFFWKIRTSPTLKRVFSRFNFDLIFLTSMKRRIMSEKVGNDVCFKEEWGYEEWWITLVVMQLSRILVWTEIKWQRDAAEYNENRSFFI